MATLLIYEQLKVAGQVHALAKLEEASTLLCHRRHIQTSNLDRQHLVDQVDLLMLQHDSHKHHQHPEQYLEIADR